MVSSDEFSAMRERLLRESMLSPAKLEALKKDAEEALAYAREELRRNPPKLDDESVRLEKSD